jgi:hypothetical protein
MLKVCDGMVCDGMVCDGVVCDGMVCDGMCDGMMCDSGNVIGLQLVGLWAFSLWACLVACGVWCVACSVWIITRGVWRVLVAGGTHGLRGCGTCTRFAGSLHVHMACGVGGYGTVRDAWGVLRIWIAV